MTQTVVAQATEINKVEVTNNTQGNLPSSRAVGNSQGNLPEKKFRAGGVSATVWLNKGTNGQGEVTEYRTISIERNYKDKEGNWKTTNSFRINDLPKLTLIGSEAYKHLIYKEQELFA